MDKNFEFPVLGVFRKCEYFGVWHFFRYFLGIPSKFDYFMGLCVTNVWFLQLIHVFWGVLLTRYFLAYGADAGPEPMYEQMFREPPGDKLFPMKVEFKSLI